MRTYVHGAMIYPGEAVGKKMPDLGAENCDAGIV